MRISQAKIRREMKQRDGVQSDVDRLQRKGKARKLAIFDLDGTLALNEHRVHFIHGEKKDWKAFHNACDGDKPNNPVIALLRSLVRQGYDVEIWTGRIDTVRVKTEKWLALHGMKHVPLKMRPAHDHTPDTDLKQQWMNEARVKPFMTFEDRFSVVQMWRRNDIVCLQVAPGDF